MGAEKKYNIYWTKEYNDGKIVEHKSVKRWPLERAMYLASVGEKLTKKPHVIKEVDESIPYQVIVNG